MSLFSPKMLVETLSDSLSSSGELFMTVYP